MHEVAITTASALTFLMLTASTDKSTKTKIPCFTEISDRRILDG